MMQFLIRWSINNRWLVISAAFIVSIIGFWCAGNMAIDVLPDLNRPTVVIIAEAHDLTPDQTALQIALPIERAMNGIIGAERVSSQTGKGMTVIKVEFGWGTDIYRNRQIVSEKLQDVRSLLPTEGEINVAIAPVSSIMGQIQLIGLTSRSGNTSLEDLRQLAETQIKYDIMSIQGVAKVIVSGGSPKQLQVIVDNNRLRAYGVSLTDVEAAVANANLSKSGGMINIGANAPIITLDGYISGPEDLGKALVKTVNGRPVVIRDVADLTFGPAEIKTGEAGVNGKPGIILVVMKQPGTDTVDISRKIDHRFAERAESLPPDVEVCLDLFSQRLFIERALGNLESAVRDGALMVVVILFVFLMNWRTTVITLTAIPVSIAITAVVFALAGFSINTMTLGGLAVGIGSLVDSAIVDVENCFRRLRQNRLRPKAEQKDPMEIVYQASVEVRGAVVMATLLVIIVYLPLFFLSGMEGKLFVPIGVSYIISMGASLLVAMTLTVALCAVMLPNHLGHNLDKDSWIVRHLKSSVDKMVHWSLNHAWGVLVAFGVCVVGSLALLGSAGTQFLPEFNEGVAQINLILPPETGLPVSSEIGSQAERILMEIPGVKNLSRRTGRAEEDEHAHGVNASDIIVSFDDSLDRSREEIIGDIRERLEHALPGVLVSVEQPLSHLISAMLSGVKAQVAIKIYGPDFPQLQSLALQVEAALKPIPGVKDLMIEQQKPVPLVEIIPKREQLARLGLTVGDLSKVVDLALGEDASSVHYEGRNTYPVIIRLLAEQRTNLKDIESLFILNDAGQSIRLDDVAEVRIGATLNAINHENNERLITVQHNIAERPLGDVIADVEKALAPIQEKLKNTPNYHLKISGQYEAQQSATQYIFGLSFASLALMILILFFHFRSWRYVIQALFSIPMSLIGASIFIALTGQSISISTLVGLIAMTGVAASNAILLLDHYEHLMKEEHVPFGKAMISQAGQERMTPVLMTALTSGIALIPLVFHPEAPGKEILYPVASVIIGGLISCTLLDFTVRPALFWLFSQKRRETEKLSS